MKNIKDFILESSINMNDYYIDVEDLNNDETYLIARIDDDGYASPLYAIFHKHGNDAIFSNSDDDRDFIELKDTINSGDKEVSQIAIFDNEKDADNACSYYNDIYNM